eukprot:UN16691
MKVDIGDLEAQARVEEKQKEMKLKRISAAEKRKAKLIAKNQYEVEMILKHRYNMETKENEFLYEMVEISKFLQSLGAAELLQRNRLH